MAIRKEVVYIYGLDQKVGRDYAQGVRKQGEGDDSGRDR